jgi:hypothetical protein
VPLGAAAFVCGGSSAAPGCFGGTRTDNGFRIGPSGDNFLALDGALQDTAGVPLRASISQTININGLTPGVPTKLQFDWAAAQQTSFSGVNTEQVQVTLGNETEMTKVVTNASHGFVDWMHEDFRFTPTSNSELLTFLAIGTPEIGTSSAGPPFVLLDGENTLQVVPEPGYLDGSWSKHSLYPRLRLSAAQVYVPAKAGDA